jgi:hypothetical protein
MSKKEKSAKVETPLVKQQWIKKETGIKVIIATSIAMTVLTGIQTVPALGWLEGSLWALGYGLMIWVIFYGYLYISRLLRR